MNDRSASLANFYRQVARGDGDMMNILRSLSDAWESIAALMEGDLGSGLSGQYRSFGRTTPSPGKKTPTSPNVVRCWIAPISDTIRSHLAQTLPWRLDEVGPGVERAVMSKMIRMRAIEARAGVGRMGDGDLVRNLEAAIKSALYCHIRFLSNNVSAGRLDVPPGAEAAMFFFIREFAYAAMFRFNSQGGFNVPYGGMTYNRKNFRSKVERLADADLAGRLSAAILENMDFEDFLKKVAPGEGDFIFLDPPYDTEFSEYDRNAFSADDQKRLADCLLPSRAKWMVVIKDTPLIRSLYTKPGIRIRSFGKKYMWTIKQRNNRDVVHLMITNY
jgi:DNA adenine methylase